ncbi:SACE_7040 family transcriptional regulator [Microbacterium allomyrinae]|jgi:AcrR family transcriptional regulator|uniref:TetR/AcrR family transcriptional regulator n=1 Tax=Microbacterium allomyrinae TaxID=2830666 RepID=A0A9X1LUF1_9MICO|nr:TetR/AcrR family transcriptional regulator [Microbacterium allomyrinae]MCC2032026.1 TetR/AcrR family transcriptional regulator [Microbacterium allomyrinae]
MTSGVTERDRAKADRHAAILHEAAALFAERGFSGVSLEDIGSAVGVSGPALYRHFANKQALLGAILVEVSERLLAGGRTVLAEHSEPADQLDAIIAFHVEFALRDADVIRVQDRDLASLADEDRHTVRRLQREYVEVWIGILASAHPGRDEDELRVRAHACFGLINSTPHSVRALRAPSGERDVGGILQSMARAALMS